MIIILGQLSFLHPGRSENPLEGLRIKIYPKKNFKWPRDTTILPQCTKNDDHILIANL